MRLLAFFADQLSALSNQLITEKSNAEPPLVLKAREYIDKHKNEELSLADVAKAAGASVFHFCKVFHKATGLKFTDYVARVRLEDARNRLLNPNLRISEIAYDVGFQSLTQFNRTFKRVFGQSPTEFRARGFLRPNALDSGNKQCSNWLIILGATLSRSGDGLHRG